VRLLQCSTRRLGVLAGSGVRRRRWRQRACSRRACRRPTRCRRWLRAANAGRWPY